MIQSYCRRVNGYGRHKFDIDYVEENIKLYYCWKHDSELFFTAPM